MQLALRTGLEFNWGPLSYKFSALDTIVVLFLFLLFLRQNFGYFFFAKRASSTKPNWENAAQSRGPLGCLPFSGYSLYYKFPSFIGTSQKSSKFDHHQLVVKNQKFRTVRLNFFWSSRQLFILYVLFLFLLFLRQNFGYFFFAKRASSTKPNWENAAQSRGPLGCLPFSGYSLYYKFPSFIGTSQKSSKFDHHQLVVKNQKFRTVRLNFFWSSRQLFICCVRFSSF